VTRLIILRLTRVRSYLVAEFGTEKDFENWTRIDSCQANFGWPKLFMASEVDRNPILQEEISNSFFSRHLEEA
jgi:hypothetical protein